MSSQSANDNALLIQSKHDDLQRLTREYQKRIEQIEDSRRVLARKNSELVDIADTYEADIAQYIRENDVDGEIAIRAHDILRFLRDETDTHTADLQRQYDRVQDAAESEYRIQRSRLMQEISDLESQSRTSNL